MGWENEKSPKATTVFPAFCSCQKSHAKKEKKIHLVLPLGSKIVDWHPEERDT